ncbi:MAG: L-rhamnose mutarotase [Alloprevotella sp.]|nr:L-rhamnose mutarotase [Alloprevotella sp.]
MDLRKDAALVAEYRRRHEKREIWPEVTEGIKAVGISAMDIYILGTRLVMILELPDDVNLNEAMKKLSTLPRQQEWEDYMSEFQQTEAGATSNEKWQDMEQMFSL